MTSSMTDVYCGWFESIPPEVAKELAVLLMRLFPGGLLEPTLATPNVTDGLVPRIRRLAGRSGFADVGTALTLAKLTDFVMADRGDPSRWAEDRERLEVLDEAREALGDEMHADVAEWVAQNRLRYPLRAKFWEKASQSWTDLRGGPLSDLEIRAVLPQFPVHD